MERDTLDYDVLIVGGGPAGLAAALRLAQLGHESANPLRICVLEKGAAIGAHILSGAVIDPAGLDELLPDWRRRAGFAYSEVSEERHLLLSEDTCTPFPAALLPPSMRLRGGILASLGDLCHWLGQEAEKLGVDLCPGFAAVSPLIEHGALQGVITGDLGRNRQGQPKPGFTPGVEIRARYTLIAEGARGSLAKQLETHFGLPGAPQKYALGLKELWRLPAEKQQEGLAIHARGWPLDDDTLGGAFLYHLPGGLAAVGLVVHLDYANPYLSPFEEFQRCKQHPALREHLLGGERLGFGARTIACGGLQSLPELTFPGGALLGCSAGLLNPARGKGIHAAMLSGIAAAEAAFAACLAGREHDELIDYADALTDSRLWDELTGTRNFKPWLSRGHKYLAGAELWASELKLPIPWTLPHRQPDHASLRPAREYARIAYPPADGQISFDLASSLQAAGVQHEEDQPNHLQISDPAQRFAHAWSRYAAPETRYCPAGVYEIDPTGAEPGFLLHPGNCLHCKTCDIKDPTQQITWSPPEGGGGPNFRSL